jgi:hypothetical protein
VRNVCTSCIDYVRSLIVLLRAQCFLTQTIELTSKVAYYNSISLGSELSSRERFRLFGVVIGGRVVGEVEVGI